MKNIAIGFDLGMGTPGGFVERIRIPADWAVKCPPGLTLHSSMIIGTAGFTAAECVQKLEHNPADARVRPSTGNRRYGWCRLCSSQTVGAAL